MLGSAVSSSSPSDFQPSSVIGCSEFPLMNRQPTHGCRGWPYAAVGMQSALHSAIGLPRRSTKAAEMLGFLIPAEVRRNLMDAPYGGGASVVVLAGHCGRISMETAMATKTHRRSCHF